MNIHIHMTSWMYRTMIILGFILFTGVISVIILLLTHQSTPELLVTMSYVAGAGLTKLLISPLNRGLDVEQR